MLRLFVCAPQTYQNEGVQEMAFDARRTEGGVVRLEEHYAHDVVADVALSLQLLGIMPLVRQLCGNVKHNLYRTPVCINGVKS